MSDPIERPLSADVADAAQKRVEVLERPQFAFGVVMPQQEFQIEHEAADGGWDLHRHLGVMSFRTALLEFMAHRRNWVSDGEMRLMTRPVEPWEIAATERTLEALEGLK